MEPSGLACRILPANLLNEMDGESESESKIGSENKTFFLLSFLLLQLAQIRRKIKKEVNYKGYIYTYMPTLVFGFDSCSS